MTDAGDNENVNPEIDIVDAEPVVSAAEQLKQATGAFNLSTVDLNQSLSNLAGQAGNIPGLDQLQKFGANVPSIARGTRQAGSAFGVVANKLSVITKGSADKHINSLTRAFKSASKESGTLGDVGKSVYGFLTKNSQELTDVVKSGGALYGFSALKEAIQGIGDATGLNQIQKEYMALDKEVLGAGLAFGQPFRDAQGSVNAFHKELAHTLVTTRKSPKEIAAVRDGLKDAFGSADQLTRLGNLSKAQDNIRAGLNLTNAALLVATAKGMEEAKVAEMMSQAHLELGEDIAGSATIFGDIALAADKAGMSFGKASESIMKSAGNLKMWGGQVSSVTPLFEAFTRKLGDGQKGLAVDLLNQYTTGLAGMGLEMRALIGLQAPGGTGGAGAIGAGLEMEAALEDGEGGMEKVSDNLIATLKKFSGGEVVTREQAIKNPAMERAFILQRQLLKQMIGGDDASNTKMLGLLQDIDANGLKTGGDAESKLGEILGSGEKTQDATTTAIEKASNDEIAALHTFGGKMLDKFDVLLNAMGADKIISAMQNTLSRTAEQGDVGIKTIEQMGNYAGGTAGETFQGLADAVKDMLGIEVKTNEQKQAVATGALEGNDVVNNAFRKLSTLLESKREATLQGKKGGFNMGSQAKSRLAQGKSVQTRFLKPAFNEIIGELDIEIKKLKKKLKSEAGLSVGEASRLTTLESGKKEIEAKRDSKRINPEGVIIDADKRGRKVPVKPDQKALRAQAVRKAEDAVELIPEMRQVSGAGGEIITQEEAKSGGPEMQQAFDAQVKLLQKSTNVGHDDAMKMLEMLKKIDSNAKKGEVTVKTPGVRKLISKFEDTSDIKTGEPTQKPQPTEVKKPVPPSNELRKVAEPVASKLNEAEEKRRSMVPTGNVEPPQPPPALTDGAVDNKSQAGVIATAYIPVDQQKPQPGQKEGVKLLGEAGTKPEIPDAQQVARDTIKSSAAKVIERDHPAAEDVVKKEGRSTMEADAARDVVSVYVTNPSLPIKLAQQTTTVAQEKKQEQVTKSISFNPVEQDIKLNITADKNSITIEIDEAHIRKVLTGEVNK